MMLLKRVAAYILVSAIYWPIYWSELYIGKCYILVSAGQKVRKYENLKKEDDVNDAENDAEADAKTGAETNPENDPEAKGIGVKETHKS